MILQGRRCAVPIFSPVPGALPVGKFRSADAYFALLDVSRGEPRREFIQDNALSVANLDI